MQLSNITILVISIAHPILIGVYKNDELIKTISQEGKTSDILPSLFEEILLVYDVEKICYVNGPGSYMAIKIAYIFLKTISLVNKIELYAVSGFDLNNNSPIKALGKKYFFRKNPDNKDEITIELLEDNRIEKFLLPQTLNNIKFDKNVLPKYNLPAV